MNIIYFMTSLFINLPNLILNLYRHILFTFLTKVALRFMFKKKKKNQSYKRGFVYEKY